MSRILALTHATTRDPLYKKGQKLYVVVRNIFGVTEDLSGQGGARLILPSNSHCVVEETVDEILAYIDSDFILTVKE
jgi:hypothetical protein